MRRGDSGRSVTHMTIECDTRTSGPVIVGLDGAASGRDACALGQRVAELLDASVDVVTLSGRRPDDALRRTAEARNASVVVLGPTRRRSLLARTLRGTARRLLTNAPCPVVIAPEGFADRPDRPLRHVGVGFEPTPEGAVALAVAHRLAARAGGTLRAIGVGLPLSPLTIDHLREREPFLEAERRTVQAGLERALAELPDDVPTTAEA